MNENPYSPETEKMEIVIIIKYNQAVVYPVWKKLHRVKFFYVRDNANIVDNISQVRNFAKIKT
jgi:hypothetical protein